MHHITLKICLQYISISCKNNDDLAFTIVINSLFQVNSLLMTLLIFIPMTKYLNYFLLRELCANRNLQLWIISSLYPQILKSPMGPMSAILMVMNFLDMYILQILIIRESSYYCPDVDNWSVKYHIAIILLMFGLHLKCIQMKHNMIQLHILNFTLKVNLQSRFTYAWRCTWA